MLNPAFLFHNRIVHGNVFLLHAYKTGSAATPPKGSTTISNVRRRQAMLTLILLPNSPMVKLGHYLQTTKVSDNIPARSALILLLYLVLNCKTVQLVRQALVTAPALLIAPT